MSLKNKVVAVTGASSGSCRRKGTMASDKTIAVNFSQEAATSQVLSHPNLISSHQTGWNGMYLEYHNSPSHETPEHYPIQHIIAIQTEGLVHSERRLDGQFRREQIRVRCVYRSGLCPPLDSVS